MVCYSIDEERAPNELDALTITHGSIAIEAIKAKEALALQGKKDGRVLDERIMP